MKTQRKLKDIVVKEISLVDKPANKKKFLFFKRQGKPDDGSLEKVDTLNVNIESDGTAGGTKIAINDKDLGDLRAFSFSFWETDKEGSPVNCSYSKVVASEDGFSRTETFYLSKGETVMNKEIEKLLREFFGDDKLEFEKAELNDETITSVKDSLTVINQYTQDLPTDLKDAIGNIAKHASQGYKQEVVEKAGAKFSKEVLAKLKAIVAAAKALQDMLPAEKTEKADSEEVGELKEQVEKLTKAVEKFGTKATGGTGTGDEPTELEKITKALTEVTKRLDAVEKGGGVQKGITGQEDTNDGEGKKWPSFQPS